MATEPLQKIAIVGATGHIGKVFAEALLKTGKHTVTALTREESKGTVPPGVQSIRVNYADHESLVAALRGQQFLIITLAVRAPPDLQSKIVQAAADAGVRYVMPNTYGTDIRSPRLKDMRHGPIVLAALAQMESLGIAYVAMACGVWYEWSLALGERWFGFTIKERKVTFIDDGETAVEVSTWTQCGRAVAALLGLPERGASPCLADWANAPLYVTSFRVSQRDMLDSLHRVLGTSDADWEITFEAAAKRQRDGQEELAKGNFTGIAKVLYGDLFIRSRAGESAVSNTSDNARLGLPAESLDEATKRAVEWVESGWNSLAPAQ